MIKNHSLLIDKELEEHIAVLNNSKKTINKKIPDIIKLITKTLNNNKKIIIIGNGGSAADSIHFSAELAGKFKSRKRKPLNCISLSENISTITAIGNDFNFDEIFSRQLMAIGKQGDLLMGISTSALSKNIYNAFKQANKMKINTIGLFGNNKTAMVRLCDISLNVKSIDTARIQEMHILIIHTICQILDDIY
tara:strand:+ start:1703 stop:2281 length:579 start_codon:yes stop_codon:yes gene_type:complete